MQRLTFDVKLILIALTVDPTPLTPENNIPSTRMSQPLPFKGDYSDAIPGQNPLKPNYVNAPQPQGPPNRQSFTVEVTAHPRHPAMEPTPTSSIASSTYKRQKLSHGPGRQASLSPTPQRAMVEKDRVDALINQFATLLEDIFEAEDAFNPRAEIPTEGSLTFFASESLHEEKPWLSKEVHRKLEAHLKRLAKTRAGRDGLTIDAADLGRLTGICERCVKAAEEIDLKSLEDDKDAERDWVVKKLGKVENAILAAHVIMLLIAGRGSDQQVPNSET